MWQYVSIKALLLESCFYLKYKCLEIVDTKTLLLSFSFISIIDERTVVCDADFPDSHPLKFRLRRTHGSTSAIYLDKIQI